VVVGAKVVVLRPFLFQFLPFFLEPLPPFFTGFWRSAAAELS